MKTLKQVLVLLMAGGMLAPALAAQSVWQKMKQAAKQADQKAQAQQHATQTAGTNVTSGQAATQTQSTTQVSSAAADPSSPALQAVNRKLEVGGVWLGMPADAAQATILKRNPKLTANPHHFGFAETQNTSYTDQIVFSEHVPDYSNTVETMNLGLTLQPMPLQVAYITRHTQYSETQAPTIANTVEALRAKYGLESVILPKDPTSTTTYIWFFDGSGKQIKPTDRFGSIAACGQSSPSTVLSMLKQNEPSTVDQYCSNLTVLAAALEEWTPRRTLHNGQTMPLGVLFQMSVTAISNPLLQKSTAETRNMLISARKGEQQQKKNSANKNVPTL